MSEISCRQVLRELELYLDGELGSERSAELAGHLVECASCFDHADFRRKLQSIIRTKAGSPTPEDLVERIKNAIRSQQQGDGWG